MTTLKIQGPASGETGEPFGIPVSETAIPAQSNYTAQNCATFKPPRDPAVRGSPNQKPAGDGARHRREIDLAQSPCPDPTGPRPAVIKTAPRRLQHFAPVVLVGLCLKGTEINTLERLCRYGSASMREITEIPSDYLQFIVEKMDPEPLPGMKRGKTLEEIGAVRERLKDLISAAEDELLNREQT